MYTHDRKQYNEQKEAIEKLKNWVLKTTSQHLLRTVCKPTENIKEWYSNLTKQVGVSEARQKQDAREIYRSALKPLSKAPRDALGWLSNWERAISFAKEKKVAEAQDSTDWFADFAIAVKPFTKVMEQWVTAYRIVKKEQIDLGTLSYRTLANDFCEEVKSTPSNAKEIRRTIAKGTFGPSFAADHSGCASGDAPSDEKRRVVERKGATNPRKRKYTGGSQSVCPACGNSHTLEICYYTFPEKAPKWFRFRRETQDTVEKALEENSQLKKEVTRLKSKKSKDSQKGRKNRT